MTDEYEDKEREFLQTLKADTGRDLGEWMDALTAQAIPERNDRIDWFRHQGFIFAWASWLERIHHNGGRPIYLDTVPESIAAPDAPASLKATSVADEPAPASTPAARSKTAPPSANLQQEPNSDAPPLAAAPSATRTFDPLAALPSGTIKTADEAALAKTISSAKAYAPLMTFLLGQIAQRLPDAFAVPGRSHVTLTVSKRRAAPFALIAITPSDLKLGLQLGTWPVKPPLEKARFAGSAQKPGRDLTHMITLTDARQIEAGLVNLIEAAHTRARTA